MKASELLEASEVVGHHLREATGAMRSAISAIADLATAVATLVARANAAATELAVIERIRAEQGGGGR